MGRKETTGILTEAVSHKTPVTQVVYLDILKERKLSLVSTFHSNTRMEHRCGVCQHTFLMRKAPIVKGLGCPKCENRPEPKTRSRHTEDTFRSELQQRFNLKLKRGSFKALGKPATFKCEEHGIFERSAGDVLKNGCPDCRRVTAYLSRTLEKDVWEARIREKHGDTVRLLGQYLGLTGNRRYRFKCYVCFNTWKAQLPSVAIKGTGCPHCANQKKTKAGYRVKEFTRDGVVFRVQGWEYHAISWILDNKQNIQASDILTESSSKIPVFRYKFGRRSRNYYPDLYIPKLNAILEVKSSYTLGLTESRRSKKEWRKNQAKAKAVLAKGYKYVMMAMNEKGTRYALPKDWYERTRESVLLEMAYRNATGVPEGVLPIRKPLSSTAEQRLLAEVRTEKLGQV